MSGMRLPLQLGRASLNQGARFAACVWLGPLLLILAAMFAKDVTIVGVMVIGLAGVVALMLAVDAANTARRDRASDIVLDATGFSIEGGPLDKTRCTWSEVDAAGCKIAKGEPRLAVRWLIPSWLTSGKIAFIAKRVRVPVHHLVLPRDGTKDLVLAEAEGDELESLEQLRDSIRGTAAPAREVDPDALPQDILRCPHCSAPQVPTATAKMTCPWCNHELEVPAELRERVSANAELEHTSGSRATLVRKLVDQPSARRAGHVVTWCRRVMVWSQPAALVLLIVLVFHQTHHVDLPAGMGIVRESPSDDGVFFYDIALLWLAIAATFGIAWSLGHAYVANRQALRVLADNFGAVPPSKPGAPSTCHQCGAPLPAATTLLVHCVYCAAENVLGIDPRPAALRRKRERLDLRRGMRRRRHARIRMAIVLPLSATTAFAMSREVRLAWHVPERITQRFESACVGRCGTIANADPVRRTFAISKAGTRVLTTLLPHGKVRWSCYSECTIEVDGTRVTPGDGIQTDVRIEHGAMHPVAP